MGGVVRRPEALVSIATGQSEGSGLDHLYVMAMCNTAVASDPQVTSGRFGLLSNSAAKIRTVCA